jgi:hypothetical protein
MIAGGTERAAHPSSTKLTEETLMNIFRRIFGRSIRRSGSRFNRYYGGILHSGVGYPTADEARRDLAAYDRTTLPFGWPH